MLAMFPLGSVLVPHQPLSLHVFEPRYRALVADVLASDRSFGVVLIERGHEVGGGDARFDVGCLAVIDRAEETPDGRWGLWCVGTERLRVRKWLMDDPYPRAEVELDADGPWTPDAAIAMARATDAFGRVIEIARQLGAEIDDRVLDVPDDPEVAHWHLVGRAPVGDLDRLALLSAETPERRLDLLAEQLRDLEVVLASRRGGG